jgi:hypothetical protein
MANQLARFAAEAAALDARLANEVQSMYDNIEKYRKEITPLLNDLKTKIDMHRTSPNYSTTRPSDEIRPSGKLLEMKRLLVICQQHAVALDEHEGIFYEEWLDWADLSRAQKEEHVRKAVEELERVYEAYRSDKTMMLNRITGVK